MRLLGPEEVRDQELAMETLLKATELATSQNRSCEVREAYALLGYMHRRGIPGGKIEAERGRAALWEAFTLTIHIIQYL